MNDTLDQALDRARSLASRGEDETAKAAYLGVLHLDPTNFAALNELGALAAASGHRSAARTAYAQAVRCHPNNPIGLVNLGNLLLEDGDSIGAKSNFEAALNLDPEFPEAHQGLARTLMDLNDGDADAHWLKGFSGHAVVTRPYRGSGPAIPILLLVSARGGNIRTQQWINDRLFTVTAIYCEFFEPTQPLPRHKLVVNAIGDAELCADALDRAETLIARVTAPVINSPTLVKSTGRADNARRLGKLPDVVAPKTIAVSRTAASDTRLTYPLLLRSPGFHTGQHFAYVENHAAMAKAVDTIPGENLLMIEYLDARGQDGMARKYRVMFIDGVLYPLHLAISTHWKVHYFTADMATNVVWREEERHFLDDMPTVLGQRAMTALAGINKTMGLDYAGVDFAVARDGSVLLFEANATMVVIPPDPNPIWDYRRQAIEEVSSAVTRMVSRRLAGPVEDY